MSLLKKDKFSIRKIKGIVGSVFLGSLLFAPSVVGASTYHYLDYSSLTQTERDQLKQGIPDESKESYALDYEKDALPNTGSSQSIMTALGLLAIGSLIVIITKDNRNKKIATFLIVGATGLVTLSTASALNLNANIHESGRDGVLQISGYRYVGYLELDDKTVSSVSPASTVSPVEQPKVVTEKGEPEVHEKPDYTQPIGANLVEPEVHEKLAYTEPVGTTGLDENGNLIEPPVNDIPEYTEPVGTTGVDENGNLIEPPVSDIPEYTEPISTVSEVASEREELPSLHTDIRTETIPKTTIEESDPSKFIGDDSVRQVGEDGERQIVTSYEELHGKKISDPVETVTILKEMKPKILVKGTKEKPKEKTAPVLTLDRTNTNVLNRSATLSYHLVNTDGVTINKITATIKDGNEIVKTVDLTSEQLDKQVEDLKFYKDYKIETTMTYDRGKGEETATLEEKPLRLDLKKVEIKNIASTNLVKVNDDGTETPSDFMTEKPSDEDVKKMYLKITSRDNKVTRLAVDKIEEVTEEGKKLYKITAEAQDLIQHTDPTKVRNKYVHYIEKPVPKVDDVYYNFKELVDAMNADKNGTFKIGADLNATNVPTPNKQYVPGTFKEHLSSVDGKQYTIHNIARPLFDRVENGSVKNINLGNVDINMPWADGIAPVANMVKNATVEDVKVTGNVVANNNIAGIVNKIDNGRMILPLLTLKDAHMFLISTYNTMAYSSFEKYGKHTEEARNEFKTKIDEVAHAQQTYLDFWSRLALPNVRDRLLKSQNMVPTPVWDNQTYNGSPVGRRGFDSKGNPIAPIRELYGPTWRHHDRDWRMGAMASIFPNPNNDDKVLFMVTDMISPFGISAFTHETTHVNDRMLYFGGHKHRQGTDVEAYAQGMLQTPDSSTTNGEYGALGINMAYHRPNDGNQWYNPDPDKLKTRDDIDRYMRNYNEAMMLLDHVEADAVLPKIKGDNSKWFKKIDKEMRSKIQYNDLLGPNQWDSIRDLKDEEKVMTLSSVNDLVDNNFMTKHGNPGNGRYRPEDFTPNSAYVNVNMMAGIYGGNTSQGAPGSLSFKHNAFRMWGYYGYENGFISYVSNKYKAEADKNNHGLLSDKLIINKVSKGNFNTLEEWKRHWYGEVLAKAKKGFEAIDIDGVHISNYDELRPLFDKAVEEDLKKPDDFSHTVALKSKVFKALLKNTDGFFNKLFKEDI
ncbi:TPA: SIALI-17 repeat-containing surface protein [Streptococcus pneumoniae]